MKRFSSHHGYRSLTRDFSIGFLIIILLISILVFSISGLIFLKIEGSKFKEDVSSTFQNFKNLIVAPLWHYDDDEVAAICKTFLSGGMVSKIVINSDVDQQLYSFGNTKEDESDIGYFTDNLFYNTKLIGKVEFYPQKPTYFEHTKFYFYTTILAISIISIFITIATWRLLRIYVNRPLDKLLSWINQVGKGEYDSAKIEYPQREIQSVVNHFSLMVDSIKTREQRIRESEERFKILFEYAPEAYYLNDFEGAFIDGNKKAEDLLGYKREELVGKSFLELDLLSVKELHKATELLAENMAGKPTGPDEFTLKRKDGRQVSVEISTIPIAIGDQDLVLGIARDITERKQAEDTIREERDKAQNYLDIASVILVGLNSDQTIALVNKKGCEILEYNEEEIIGKNWFDNFLPERMRLEVKEAFDKLIAGEIEPVKYFENPVLTKSNKEKMIAWHNAVLRDDNGNIISTLSSGEDITERKLHEKVLATRLVLSEFSATHTVDELLQRFLDEAEALTGSSIGFFHFFEQDQKTISLQMWSTSTLDRFCTAKGKGIHYPIDKAGVWADAIRERRPVIHNDYKSLQHRKGMPEGHAPLIRELVVPVFREGKIVGILGVGNKESDYVEKDVKTVVNIADMAWDIVIRKRVEEELQESEEKYRSIFENASEGILQTSPDGRLLIANPALAGIVGFDSPKELMDHVKDLSTDLYVDPERRKELLRQVERDGFVSEFEADLQRKDGSIATVSINVHAVPDDDGQIQYIEGTLDDITERKKAEKDKMKLLSQLQQAQKMEAIGTLAGGIAHDFNNILSIIFGYLDLAMMSIENPDELQKDLDEVYKGALRAKDLINQILTFSRMTDQEKQPLRLDLIIKEAIKLLRSSIPSTIEIKQDIDSQKIVIADSTQLHQIIMNLCTNAYHAMYKTSGTLAVGLKDMEISEDVIIPDQEIISGEYLQLEVSDTGHGMDEETKEKIFDPYFTTKEIGEGTGLGLAVVHGIVKSHNGFINVYSEPGIGTTFHVYLPVFKEKPASLEPTVHREPIKGGSERVMFVDDEEKIANIAYEVLTKYGYKVTLCTNGVQALQEFENNMDQYDLVITDMSMPHMNGIQLIKMIFKLKPHFPIILCSGFSELINKETADALGVKYIEKPVVMSELMRIVRKILDEVKG